MKKQNRGVTLIALVITIIVLLILAVITLNLVLGESGIIAKAQIARDKTNSEQEKENEELTNLENNINKYSLSRTDGSITKKEVILNEPITTQTATLNKSIDQFDAIIVWGQNFDGSNYSMAQNMYILKEDYYMRPSVEEEPEWTFILDQSNSSQVRRIVFGFISSTELKIASAQNMRIVKIYGINF